MRLIKRLGYIHFGGYDARSGTRCQHVYAGGYRSIQGRRCGGARNGASGKVGQRQFVRTEGYGDYAFGYIRAQGAFGVVDADIFDAAVVVVYG